MTDYKRAFKIACELLNGSNLYGVDTGSIFEDAMNKDGVVDNESYEEYILSHMDELDHGQYVSQPESDGYMTDNIKALGEELRKVRDGIKDENALFGYNMAVAICNKYLSDSEASESEDKE